MFRDEKRSRKGKRVQVEYNTIVRCTSTYNAEQTLVTTKVIRGLVGFVPWLG